MKLVKVFDSHLDKPPSHIHDIMGKYAVALGHGNDLHFSWLVGDMDSHSLTDQEAKLVDEWLLSEGAEIGDDILIYYWW